MGEPKPQPLHGHVYYDVVRLISSGRYPAGSRLDEQQIAEELGVSRTPLREAISKLVNDGLVANRPYRGNFVRQFTAKGVVDLYEVRKGLELMAVRLAIPKLNEQSITELRSILADINAALEAHDLDAYGLADQRFHAAIARMSDNDTLIGILTQLTRQVQLIRAMANQDPSIVESTAMERPEIVDAMVADDIDKATRLMEGHIELVRRNATERIGEPATGVTAESIVRAT